MMREEENEPQPLRIIGTPKRMEDNKYAFDNHVYAILNKECGWICPSCYNEVRICPTQAGEQTFKCSNRICKATFTLRVDADATTFLAKKKKPADIAASAVSGAAGVAAAGAAGVIAVQQQVQQPAKGMLLMSEDDDRPKESESRKTVIEMPEEEDDNETVIVRQSEDSPACGNAQQESTGTLQWGGFFSRKHYKLLAGANIIGRKDKKTPSDLEFADPEMSRRSVKIDAIPNGQGNFNFTLTVQKALNPVKVNDNKLHQGDSITLKHNDSIVMGKTTITFKCS